MGLITQKEAAAKLGKSKAAVSQAVQKGVLTSVSQDGQKGLDSEQVALFVGRTLSPDSLNDDERKRWQAIADKYAETASPSEMRAISPMSLPSVSSTPYMNREEEARLVGDIYSQVAAAIATPVLAGLERTLASLFDQKATKEETIHALRGIRSRIPTPTTRR
jgi:hypothetical protein